MQDSFVEALKETDLEILGSPKIDPPELTEKEPYKYDAVVQLRPEIEDVEFKGLSLKKTLYKVSEEEVDSQLKMLQKNIARLETIEEERPVQEGDAAVIDYEGFKDGEPFEKTQKTQNFTLKVGVGIIAKDFDRQVIGMKPSETKEFNVKFADDHVNKDLAGL
ncbi:MAG: FKBP-type peptidyl-prolyl cis-trans isomerase, partial [Deltaproteobacteria bacterium]|nr:FKBP-type peptidyl-prolyl cis-trans isomerase [Deltaproteobacteria bacterium]